MNDVEYHNNVSERALRRFAEFRKILYGNRSDAGARRTKILMSVYATCEQRGVNFYQFVQDYLSGKTGTILPGPAQNQTSSPSDRAMQRHCKPSMACVTGAPKTHGMRGAQNSSPPAQKITLSMAWRVI